MADALNQSRVDQALRRSQVDFPTLFRGGESANNLLLQSILGPAAGIASFQQNIQRPEQQGLIASLERAGQTQIAEALSGGSPSDLGLILGGLGTLGSAAAGAGGGAQGFAALAALGG